MTERNLPEFFADDIVQVFVADGVFRLVFAQAREEGGQRPVFRLLVPMSQLPKIMGGLENSQKEIAEKILAQQAGGEVSPPSSRQTAPAADAAADSREAEDESGEKGKSLWSRLKDRVQSPKAKTD